MLAPGQTMLWGTKSTGFMGGTGGSLNIPLGSQTANVWWAIPWNYYNGLGGSASGIPTMNNGGGFPPPNPYSISGGAMSCGPGGTAWGYNTCVFSFELTGGPPPTPGDTNGLGASQCMAMPTQCPAGVQCSSATSSIVSSDGSTRLVIQGGQSGLSGQSAWGGVLELIGPNGTWSSHVYDVVAAQMGADGNFVAYDAWGNVVWQSGTSGNSSNFLHVDSSQMSIETPQMICAGSGIFRRCHVYDSIDWTAYATSSTVQ
jgi:hypothetical protein